MNHNIEDINLIDSEIKIFVFNDNLYQGADVTIYFLWDWDREEKERIPEYEEKFHVEFLNEDGNEKAVKEYVSHLVDECWLKAVINNQEEPQKLFDNHISD